MTKMIAIIHIFSVIHFSFDKNGRHQHSNLSSLKYYINKYLMNALPAIASMPLTTHQLMELCKTKSDEPDG